MMGRKRDDHGFEAVPAYVVADKTDKVGKRLSYLAVGLLVLFFAASSYIQSSINNDELQEAREARSKSNATVERLTRTIDAQTSLILQLQDALRSQNIALREAGLTTIEIPQGIPPDLLEEGEPDGEPRSSATTRPRGTPQSAPSTTPQPTPEQPSNPEPSPTPSPTPQRPLDVVEEAACNLTGICPN